MSNYAINLQRYPEVYPKFEQIKDDPIFDPAIHLALETPATILTLNDLGYGDEIAGTTPTEIAATSCFRILSDEGVAAMYHVCKQLEEFTTSNARIARNTRGGTYRSAFLRDFSVSTDVAEHLSGIMKTPLLPHAMPHQLSHLNYQPKTVGENIDKWHYDTLQVDYVMFVTDLNDIEGGEFQYFKGTRDEMADLKHSGQPFPQDRIIAPDIPGAGYAVLIQGNYVVHQAKALLAEGERITLVNGYNFGDINIPDYTALGQLVLADPESLCCAEFSRSLALRCGQRLQSLVNTPDYSLEAQERIQLLKQARNELDQAIQQLETYSNQAMQHFGD
jgi:hypothetical protein